MAKVEDLGRRDGINKLAEAIKTRGQGPAKPEESEKSSPDYVLKTSSLKDRAQTLIDSGQFSEEDLDFLKEVVANKDLK